MTTQSPPPTFFEPYTTGKPCNCVRVDSPPNAYTVHQGICCHCRGTVKAEPYYGHRFPETDGDVTLMDRVSPYPPEFVETYFKTERCLITRACQPPKVYRPCTDVLPRTMAWLAAGVPTDFIDRADSRMARVEADTERVLVLDGNNPDVTIVPASEMRFPEWDVLCEPPIGDEREAFFWRALLRTYGADEAIERSNLGDYGFAQVPDPGE